MTIPKLTKRQMARLEEIAFPRHHSLLTRVGANARLIELGLAETGVTSIGRNYIKITPAGRALLAGSSERQI